MPPLSFVQHAKWVSFWNHVVPSCSTQPLSPSKLKTCLTRHLMTCRCFVITPLGFQPWTIRRALKIATISLLSKFQQNMVFILKFIFHKTTIKCGKQLCKCCNVIHSTHQVKFIENHLTSHNNERMSEISPSKKSHTCVSFLNFKMTSNC